MIRFGTVSTWVLVTAVAAAVAAGKRYGNGDRRATGAATVSAVVVKKNLGGYLRGSGRVGDGGDGEADDCVEGGGAG